MPPAADDENPVWTKETFARAKPADEVLPKEVIAAFRRARGPQKAPKKTPVSVRLDPEVLAHFKAAGPRWQSRINQVLKADATAVHVRPRGKSWEVQAPQGPSPQRYRSEVEALKAAWALAQREHAAAGEARVVLHEAV